MLEKLVIALQPWAVVVLVLLVVGGLVWWALYGQDVFRQPWGARPREAIEDVRCSHCGRRGEGVMRCEFLVCSTREEGERRLGIRREFYASEIPARKRTRF